MTQIVLEVSEALAKEIQEKGLGELAFRRSDKKFREFFKAVFVERIQNEGDDEIIKQVKELFYKNEVSINKARAAMESMVKNVNHQLLNMNIDMKNIADNMGDIFKNTNVIKTLSYLNVGLSITNIAVSAAGFAILAHKLNNLSDQVNEISKGIDELKEVEENKQIRDFEDLRMRMNRIIEKIVDHENVSNDDIENLLKDVKVFLSFIIRLLNKDIFNEDLLLRIIDILLPSYTMLLCEYVDRVYFEKKKLPGSYNDFVSLYDELNTIDLRRRLYDYFFFTEGMNSIDAEDAVNIQMFLGLNGKIQVEEQVEIVKKLETKEKYDLFNQYIENETQRMLEEAINEIVNETGMDEQACREIFETAV